MEVFVNDWLVYTESIVGSPPTDTAVELFAEGGDMVVKRVDVWRLASIYPFKG